MNTQQQNIPYLNISEQIQFLQNNGLQFKDEEYAKHILQEIAYYRLSGYLAHFQHGHDGFSYNDIYFDDIVKLYAFDKRLRLLILDAVETIEVSLRSAIVSSITSQNINIFEQDSKSFADFQNSKQKCWQRSKEDFVSNINQNYDKVPIWAEIETWSMGTIRDCILSMKPQYLSVITHHFQCYENVKLKNWVRCLVYLRNISAHHSRLWNKQLQILNIDNHQMAVKVHIL